MKIVIKGSNSCKTGKQIIEILKNLGGDNINDYSGMSDWYYYIDDTGIIKYNQYIKQISLLPGTYITYESLEDYLKTLKKQIEYEDI